jgi:RNA polymerase sigma factor (sigma-70 family)
MAQLNSDLSIEEFILSIRKGEMDEQEGFRHIFEQITPNIKQAIWRMTGLAYGDEFDDIVATIWEEIWKSIDVFDPEKASFKTWVNTIARNRAIDYIRAKTAQPGSVSLDEPMGERGADEVIEIPDERTPLEEVIDSETQAAALSALMQLPEFDRTLYLLKLNYDLTYADLAEIASRARDEHITEKAVQNRFYRTRAKLLEALRDQGIID